MPQRICLFLVVFLLIFNGMLWGQEGRQNTTRLLIENKIVIEFEFGVLHNLFRQIIAPGFDNWELEKKITNFITFNGETSKKKLFNRSCFGGVETYPITQNASFLSVPSVLSPSFYNDHLGFACKKEWQLEKITMIPLRIRLGSLDYVNWLEQKPNAVRY